MYRILVINSRVEIGCKERHWKIPGKAWKYRWGLINPLVVELPWLAPQVHQSNHPPTGFNLCQVTNHAPFLSHAEACASHVAPISNVHTVIWSNLSRKSTLLSAS